MSSSLLENELAPSPPKDPTGSAGGGESDAAPGHDHASAGETARPNPARPRATRLGRGLSTLMTGSRPPRHTTPLGLTRADREPPDSAHDSQPSDGPEARSQDDSAAIAILDVPSEFEDRPRSTRPSASAPAEDESAGPRSAAEDDGAGSILDALVRAQQETTRTPAATDKPIPEPATRPSSKPSSNGGSAHVPAPGGRPPASAPPRLIADAPSADSLREVAAEVDDESASPDRSPSPVTRRSSARSAPAAPARDEPGRAIADAVAAARAGDRLPGDVAQRLTRAIEAPMRSVELQLRRAKFNLLIAWGAAALSMLVTVGLLCWATWAITAAHGDASAANDKLKTAWDRADSLEQQLTQQIEANAVLIDERNVLAGELDSTRTALEAANRAIDAMETAAR